MGFFDWLLGKKKKEEPMSQGEAPASAPEMPSEPAPAPEEPMSEGGESSEGSSDEGGMM